jgi:hypothetical protein
MLTQTTKDALKAHTPFFYESFGSCGSNGLQWTAVNAGIWWNRGLLVFVTFTPSSCHRNVLGMVKARDGGVECEMSRLGTRNSSIFC